MKTRQNLAELFARESVFSARSAVFALKARKEGKPEIARLFQALCESESVHARRYLRLLRGRIGSTRENLDEVARRVIPELKDSCRDFAAEAGVDGMKVAEEALSHSRQVAGGYVDLINHAQTDNVAAYHVCQVCGFVAENAAPLKCPVCGALQMKFKPID